MKLLSIFFLLFFLQHWAYTQCFTNNFAFAEGERLDYEVYYNWGFVWINAGFVDFDVKPGIYRNRPVYCLDAYGSSHKSYDWLFKVRDSYKSYLDKETLKPLVFKQKTLEGSFEADNKYVFDYQKKYIAASTKNSKRALKEDTLKLDTCIYDIVSMVYNCRNINFSGLNKGDSIPIITIIDNEVFNLFIRYLGKERIETREEIKYNCIKFSALLVEGTIFKGGEDLVVWVTDDKNRIPILVEAKILIGSVKAYIIGMEGVRNPLTSLVR